MRFLVPQRKCASMNGCMGVLLPLLGWLLFILLLEGTLWVLFRRKFVEIYLPAKGQETFFHLFTLSRLKALVVLHMLFLLTCVFFAHLLLWP